MGAGGLQTVFLFPASDGVSLGWQGARLFIHALKEKVCDGVHTPHSRADRERINTLSLERPIAVCIDCKGPRGVETTERKGWALCWRSVARSTEGSLQ